MHDLDWADSEAGGSGILGSMTRVGKNGKPTHIDISIDKSLSRNILNNRIEIKLVK